MTSLLTRLSLCLFVLLHIFVRVIPGDFVEPPPNHSLISMAEDRTILPCHYKPSNGTVVVQVTWLQEKPDGTKEQIITAHPINGQTAFGSWSQRVHFKSNQPTVDSSLVIMGTKVSDEGKYICHVSAFPSGNFDTHMSLIVWTHPISSVEPVTVVEGQNYRQVASCRSVARPPPRLTWDTDLNGQSVNRSSESGAISSHFSLHPLRNMNGKKLDCLVWHPTYSEPRRLKNQLVVLFPPHAEVSGYSGNWHVGLENAALSCVSGGNPKPHVFTWIREEISTLSRQASIRRMTYISTDTGRATDENIPLRVEGTLRSSLSSLGEQAQCRDSRSTLSGGRGGVGAYDSLGRPALYNNSRRGRERPVDREEESRLRVERYVKNNSLSLPETHFHPPLTPSSFQRMQSHDFMRPVNGSAVVLSDVGSRQGSVTKNHQHPPMSSTCPPIRDDDDEVDEGLGGPASQERPFDQDSETNSSQVSEATSMHCQHSNGMLKHKRLPSPTLVSPHASIIHKAQIV
ncbi:nectin-4 isoform X2 [Archocentrus centrarchus]|uniref:nectin-4 isoform X2 n=1 Tax=Archocentrus centrarchus TaxID=63155 RepID=UPI0011E9CDF2|nr:nectin-4 isoform X2 [Archocentrus centrarchus]